MENCFGEELSALDAISADVNKKLASISRPPPELPEVIVFNVNGERMCVSTSNLSKYPTCSLYRAVVLYYTQKQKLQNNKDGNNFSSQGLQYSSESQQESDCSLGGGFPIDKDGNLIIDTDPQIFAILLNYIRDYRSPCPKHLQAQVVSDAAWFHLSDLIPFISSACGDSLLMKIKVLSRGMEDSATRLEPHTIMALNSLETIGAEADSTSSFEVIGSSNVTCQIGPFFSSGVHEVTIKVLRCERLALGVMCPIVRDQLDLGKVPFYMHSGCAAYLSEGVLHHCFPQAIKEVGQGRISHGISIRMVLDMDMQRISWQVARDKIVILSMSRHPQQSIAFAATMSGKSMIAVEPVPLPEDPWTNAEEGQVKGVKSVFSEM